MYGHQRCLEAAIFPPCSAEPSECDVIALTEIEHSDWLLDFSTEQLHQNKMAECKAWGCKNNKRKNPEKHYFCVPKPNTEEKKVRVRKWLHNLGTGHSIDTFKFGANSVVSSDHFEVWYLKRDLKAELLGLPVTHRLTDDAVPTIIKHRKDTAEVSSRAERQQVREKRKVNINFFFFLFIYYSFTWTSSLFSAWLLVFQT